MTFRKAIPAAIKALAIAVLWLVQAVFARAESVRFIYIEAGEGNASGGHFAVQFSKKIYHFQYEDSFIRLFDHDADSFQLDYRFRQNRAFHVADVDVSPATYELLLDHFKLKSFTQKQSLLNIDTLRADQHLLKSLLAGKHKDSDTQTEDANQSIRIKGAALFFPEDPQKSPVGKPCVSPLSNQQVMAELHRRIEDVYGTHYLSEKINGLKEQIYRLTPSSLDKMADRSHYAFSENYRDLATHIMALSTLTQRRHLRESACFRVESPDSTLSGSGLDRAKKYQTQLYESVMRLLQSKRPDVGFALFSTLARLIVLEQTLSERKWIFLSHHDEVDDVETLEVKKLEMYPEAYKTKRQEDYQRLNQLFSRWQNKTGNEEISLAQLELAADRNRRWLESDVTGALELQSEHAVAEHNLALPILFETNMTSEQIRSYLQQLLALENTLIEKDTAYNRYNLLSKNCVSGLFALINDAVQEQSTTLLGGTIDERINFIPVQAFASVRQNYRVFKTEYLPAYREMQLERIYRDDNKVLVYLTESNSLSSTLYEYNPEDAWFVFFTDDAIAPRPVFGAFNVLAATGQTLYGMINWPFDDGENFQTGIRGVLASLPELAFFNIRKGSYPLAMPAKAP